MLWHASARVAICLTWAFLCLSPATTLAAEPHDVAPEEATVRVVFYNLKNYLAMERMVSGQRVPDAPKPEDEIQAVLDGLLALRPDILAVCEMGDASYLADFQRRLLEGGLALPESELVQSSDGQERNLALLSRYPISQRHSRTDYSYSAGGQRHRLLRGILDAEIRIAPQIDLRCVVAHLKSKREVPGADQAVLRLNEARLLRQHIDTLLEKQPDTNLLVVGDLNDYRSSSPVKTLHGRYGQAHYLTAIPLQDERGMRWTHYWSHNDQYARLDYAFHNRTMRQKIDHQQSRIHHWPGWYQASDHRPLLIVLSP